MTCKDCIHSGLCYKENDYENFPNRCGDFISDKVLDERPQGEWVFIDILEDDNFPMDKGSEIYECSVCGRRIWTFSKDLTIFYPFCHCGADMRKGGEE